MDRIKRLSTEIMDEYQDKLGTDFVTNKQFLNEVSIIRSKALKNKIAGYITKIIQRKQKLEEQKQQLIENDKKIVDKFEEQSHPLYASARLWDDGIIDPLKTRKILAYSLEVSLNQEIGDSKFGLFRM